MADIAIWHRAGDGSDFAARLRAALARQRPHWRCIATADEAIVDRHGLKALLVIVDDGDFDPASALPGAGVDVVPLILRVYPTGASLRVASHRGLAVDPDDPASVRELVDLIASHTTLGLRPLPSSLGELQGLRSAAALRPVHPPYSPDWEAAPASAESSESFSVGTGADSFAKEVVLPPPSPPPAPVPTRGSQQAAESLDVSAFAPATMARGEEALVQIFLHRPDQQADAAALAQASDAAATRRGVVTLLVAVADGQRVDVLLDVPGATVDQPAQYLVWRGEPRACQFFVDVPRDLARSTLPVRTTVMVDGAPAGSLRFILPVADSVPETGIRPEIKGDSARRYSRAFLSYASPDRAEVLKRAQALKATGVSFFQDLLSLEPGERWEKRLYEEIDRCDLFLLFWSNHARASQWVKKETDLALLRRGDGEEAVPDIVPIVLEGPPLPKPHDDWKHIHFNDWLRYVIAAVEAPPPPP